MVLCKLRVRIITLRFGRNDVVRVMFVNRSGCQCCVNSSVCRTVPDSSNSLKHKQQVPSPVARSDASSRATEAPSCEYVEDVARPGVLAEDVLGTVIDVMASWLVALNGTQATLNAATLALSNLGLVNRYLASKIREQGTQLSATLAYERTLMQIRKLTNDWNVKAHGDPRYLYWGLPRSVFSGGIVMCPYRYDVRPWLQGEVAASNRFVQAQLLRHEQAAFEAIDQRWQDSDAPSHGVDNNSTASDVDEDEDDTDTELETDSEPENADDLGRDEQEEEEVEEVPRYVPTLENVRSSIVNTLYRMARQTGSAHPTASDVRYLRYDIARAIDSLQLGHPIVSDMGLWTNGWWEAADLIGCHPKVKLFVVYVRELLAMARSNLPRTENIKEIMGRCSTTGCHRITVGPAGKMKPSRGESIRRAVIDHVDEVAASLFSDDTSKEYWKTVLLDEDEESSTSPIDQRECRHRFCSWACERRTRQQVAQELDLRSIMEHDPPPKRRRDGHVSTSNMISRALGVAFDRNAAVADRLRTMPMIGRHSSRALLTPSRGLTNVYEKELVRNMLIRAINIDLGVVLASSALTDLASCCKYLPGATSDWRRYHAPTAKRVSRLYTKHRKTPLLTSMQQQPPFVNEVRLGALRLVRV